MVVNKAEQGFTKVKTTCPYHCNNGKIFIPEKGLLPCPHCEGLQGYEERVNEDEPNNFFDVLKIPKLYRKCDNNSALQYIAEVKSTMSSSGADTEQYCFILNEVIKALEFGALYKCSLLIRELPTSKVDINTFVYGTMFYAVTKGLGVLPYIPVSWLTTLRYNNDMNTSKFKQTPLMKYSMEGVTGMSMPLMLRCKFAYDIDYYDYTVCPLVFVDVSTTATPAELSVLQGLISERAKHDLPTYVTVNPRSGGMSLKDLSTGLFDSMLTVSNYRLDRLLPVDYYMYKDDSVSKSLSGVLSYIEKNNIGVSENPFGVKGTTFNYDY